MSIVVATSGEFAIETYGGLVDWIAKVLDRDDLDADIPTFIHLAGIRLGRVLLPPARQTSDNLTTTAAQGDVILPDDFRQLIAANINNCVLEPVTMAVLYEKRVASGEPRFFSIVDGAIELAPVPDGVYNISIDYLRAITPLSDTNPTNWVLQDHADLYIYGALLQAEAYLSNDARLALWKMAFDEGISEANKEGLRYRNSASPIRLRSPVCV